MVEQDGKSLVMHGEITKYIPDKAMSFHIKSKIHSLDVDYTIREENEGSILSIDLKMRWKFPMNIIALIMGRKMRRKFLEQTRIELEELKRLCEKE